MSPQTHIKTYMFAQQTQKSEGCTARLPCWSKNKKAHQVMTKTHLYKRSREFLFQKVALGYLLQFVQNGPSKIVSKHIYGRISLMGALQRRSVLQVAAV